ncbi:MAG: response regulator [Candidatus Bathycorpusculaceae bacterium]
MDEFDRILLRVIDETPRYSLEERTAEVFYEYLRRKGFPLSNIPQDTVDVAHSGKEAIEKSKVKVYNIALLDIVLPDMQGTQLLKKAAGNNTENGKIMVSGHPNLENAVEALNYGADAYLIKPVNFENLIKVVEERLAKQSEEEAITVEKIAAFVEARTQRLLQKLRWKTRSTRKSIRHMPAFLFLSTILIFGSLAMCGLRKIYQNLNVLIFTI